MQLKKYPAISGLVISMVMIYLAAHAVQSNWNYFTAYRFKWGEQMIGYSLALVGLLVALVQTVLIRKVHPLLGQERSIYIGLLMYSLGMFMFSFANAGWMMFAFMIPHAMGGIAGAATQGIISSHVPANEQGELQGAMTSLMSLTSIVGPVLMTGLFAYFTSATTSIYFPGAPFMMGAVLTAFSLLLVMNTLKKHHS